MNDEPTRSALGRRSRQKGKSFELVVRDHIAEALGFPENLYVRRSSQAERAWEADLIIEGANAPQWLLDLWIECEHANDPDPAKKFAQGMRDAGAYALRLRRVRTPVVIWRQTGKRVIWLSTDASYLAELLGGPTASVSSPGHGLLVTVKAGPFFEMVSKARSAVPA